jgi:hypothetical protein
MTATWGRPRRPVRRHADHRRHRRDRARRHLRHARRRRGRDRGAEALRHRQRGGLRLLPPVRGRDRGRRGTPASCTTPVAEGMVVHTQAGKVKKIRRGVMELYISDHPLDCLTCAANGDCELQDMAGAVGLRDVRYGAARGRQPFRGAEHLRRGQPRMDRQGRRPTPISPMIRRNASSARRCVRACEEVQGTFALTIEGGASTAASRRACGGRFPVVRLRQLRRLRAGLPDGDAAGEIGDRARHAHALGRDDLRLLRRRLFLQGGTARRRTGAHGALQGRQGEPGPFLRQGPLRLGLRQPCRTAS